MNGAPSFKIRAAAPELIKHYFIFLEDLKHLRQDPFAAWPQGHMDQLVPAQIGLWLLMSHIGELTLASQNLYKDGIIDSTPKEYDMYSVIWIFYVVNSKDSRGWLRGNHHPTHRYSASDALRIPRFSSPGRLHQYKKSVLMTLQSKRDPAWARVTFTPTMEGSSTVRDGIGSISSRSDGSEFEHATKLHLSTTPHNFPSRCTFMSKAVHPLSFLFQTTKKGSQYDVTVSQRETHGSSSGGSSIDMTDISGPFEPENMERGSNPDEGLRCGLCERCLSQWSPWGSRRIVRSGDMPVTGVLS
ncbi:hypothetical protein AKJ16_DCAP12347 [Drosera capensis]